VRRDLRAHGPTQCESEPTTSDLLLGLGPLVLVCRIRYWKTSFSAAVVATALQLQRIPVAVGSLLRRLSCSSPASASTPPSTGWMHRILGGRGRGLRGCRIRAPPSRCAPLTSSRSPSSSTTTSRPDRASPAATSSIQVWFCGPLLVTFLNFRSFVRLFG
jgi:hypothetical protein